MKLYNRKDFLKLPANTIYSKPVEGFLMYGLYCKTSDENYGEDWVLQDLIEEYGFPNEMTKSEDAWEHVINQRDTYQDFETDLNCQSRDGMFEQDEKFVVWDKKDIKKLVDYLNKCL